MCPGVCWGNTGVWAVRLLKGVPGVCGYTGVSDKSGWTGVSGAPWTGVAASCSFLSCSSLSLLARASCSCLSFSILALSSMALCSSSCLLAYCPAPASISATFLFFPLGSFLGGTTGVWNSAPAAPLTFSRGSSSSSCVSPSRVSNVSTGQGLAVRFSW